MKRMERVGFYCTLTVLCLLMAGCGGGGSGLEMGYVTGKVTLDGAPLDGATLRFQPQAGGSPSSGRTDASGEYELLFTAKKKGAMLGEHLVTITKSLGGEEGLGALFAEETLPAKYNARSELTRNVEPGKQTIDFELVSE